MRSQPWVAVPHRLTHAAGPFFTGRPCARSLTVRTHSVFYRPAGREVEHNASRYTCGFLSRSCHESETFNVGDETLRDRTVTSVIDHDDSSHEQTMLNEANMDFRIPRLPHSVVKHWQSTSVRELIQKIENHPDRHALQQRSTTESSI